LTISAASKIRLQKPHPPRYLWRRTLHVQNQKGEKSVFTTTLTLEERNTRAQAQLTKAKENRRKAYENAAKGGEEESQAPDRQAPSGQTGDRG